ncbi:type II toxin-antitoxin system RelE family toxin [Nesterenkonia sandarakina]|uniref:mRNA interferase RelE/StbE n=1 Tax=Nesterenkonia sandarakina TaxID=272918 RepID=A0A7Z0J4R7_9MICC|nr:type II toxin-antitoxin system RelE/ParE family toxin [Nesterenkonia sandarakina]NYJ18113.1 mRNA interferase RelE/StbE [Nesterenkonia sandarakina]
MTWKIELDEDVRKTLKKLDKPVAQQILRKLREIESLDDPITMGKPLLSHHKGFWVYRVGDFRVLCDIQYGQLMVLVIERQHRSEAYK